MSPRFQARISEAKPFSWTDLRPSEIPLSKALVPLSPAFTAAASAGPGKRRSLGGGREVWGFLHQPTAQSLSGLLLPRVLGVEKQTNKQKSSLHVLRVPASLEIKFPGRGVALSLHSPLPGIFTEDWISERLLILPSASVPPKYPIPTSCLPAQPQLNDTAA